jgi:DNA-binding response OmpR family regulator
MSRARILFADDNEDLLDAMRIRLRANGFDVLTATDGVEATRRAKQDRPDLVILDIGMPGGDGHTVVERIRTDPETMLVPVIFLTARTALADFQRAEDNGVEKYITKPFQPEELLMAIEQVLETAGATTH